MGFFDDLFSQGVSTAKDAILDEHSTQEFTKEKLVSYYRKKAKKTPGIAGSIVSVQKESEFRGASVPQDRWAISIAFCDAVGKPLVDPRTGLVISTVVFANSVDNEFSRLMNGKQQIRFTPDASELQKSDMQRWIDKISAFISSAVDRSFSDTITVAYLKGFRTVKGSKVMLANAISLIKTASSRSELGLTENDYIVAEIDAQTGEILKCVIGAADAKVSTIVKQNNGIVILED